MSSSVRMAVFVALGVIGTVGFLLVAHLLQATPG
jgi:hypothetical protein